MRAYFCSWRLGRARGTRASASIRVVDPTRKRKLRLVVALTAAVLLATALIYTSFSASTEASKPSEIKPGRSYEMTGKVVKGSIRHDGDELRFRVRDRDGTASVPVAYTGVVPDPFREGREVIVSGELENGTFVAERDSLVTKCPSKFTKDEQSS
jgi:cytochrome c-type biogenesis protein CcmE